MKALYFAAFVLLAASAQAQQPTRRFWIEPEPVVVHVKVHSGFFWFSFIPWSGLFQRY